MRTDRNLAACNLQIGNIGSYEWNAANIYDIYALTYPGKYFKARSKRSVGKASIGYTNLTWSMIYYQYCYKY